MNAKQFILYILAFASAFALYVYAGTCGAEAKTLVLDLIVPIAIVFLGLIYLARDKKAGGKKEPKISKSDKILQDKLLHLDEMKQGNKISEEEYIRIRLELIHKHFD